MPPRGKASDVVRLVCCESGRVKMHMDLVIRFGFGKNAPWVRRTEDKALLAICGPDMLVLRTPVETRGKEMTTVADFEISAGQTILFVMTYGPISFRHSGADRCGRSPEGDGRILAGVVRKVRI